MSPTLWLVASSVGLVVLVALAIVYRRAAARRELELAEAAIDAEYTALDPPESARGR